ncbi:MAG TPA: hypothetical protein VF870_16435, partial [Ignavibacteriaceae bacterium]
MKWPNLILMIIIIIVFSNCERDETDDHPDWIYTAYKFLILDSNKVEYNTRAKFFRLNDSEFFLNGYNNLTQKDCFSKLMFIGNNLEIKNMKSLIYSTPRDIKDISFPNSTIGYLLMNNKEAGTGIDSKLFQTFDGGESWNEKTINLQNTFRWIHFITPDSGIAIRENYTGISYDIYSTTNSGNNWQKIVNEYFVNGRTLSDFYFIPQKPRICFLSSSGQLFYSSNGGFNWKLHSIHNADIVSMSFLNENVGFIVNSKVTYPESLLSTANSIYKINEIGGSYKKVYTGDWDILKIEALNYNEIYINKWYSMYYTSDGFTTVKLMKIQDPLPKVPGDGLVVDFSIYS